MADTLTVGAGLIGLGAGVGYATFQALKYLDSQFEELKTSAPTIQLSFTKSEHVHPRAKVIHVIDHAKSQLDIAVYSLTDQEIVNRIIHAKKRGVQVRVLTDHEQSSLLNQPALLEQLEDADIPIKRNTHEGNMHLRVTIADRSIFTIGSYNFAARAHQQNDEVLAVIQDDLLAKELEAQFETKWNDHQNYASYQSSPTEIYA